MIRILFLALLLTILAGCTLPSAPPPEPLPPESLPADPAEALFLKVLEGPAAARSEALARLNAEYPRSPWTGRAKTVSELRTARDSQAQKVRQLEQEKARSVEETQSLEEESRRLRDDLDKLKKLLIDMEMRSTR